MTAEQNKALLRAEIDALNSPDWRDRLRAAVPPGADADAILESHAAFRRAFPDYHFALEEMIAEGDTVVTRGTVTATHTAEFPLGELKGIAASGKKVQWTEVWIDHFAGGSFVEGRIIADGVARLRQLGVLKR
jgi:predicted ester cyclase